MRAGDARFADGWRQVLRARRSRRCGERVTEGRERRGRAKCEERGARADVAEVGDGKPIPGGCGGVGRRAGEPGSGAD